MGCQRKMGLGMTPRGLSPKRWSGVTIYEPGEQQQKEVWRGDQRQVCGHVKFEIPLALQVGVTSRHMSRELWGEVRAGDEVREP